MDQGEFLKALNSVPDDFFIYNGLLRTRARRSGDVSIDPIVAVARFEGYKGIDINEAVTYLKLDISFAMRVVQISDGEGLYKPEDLKLKAKILNRTVQKR